MGLLLCKNSNVSRSTATFGGAGVAPAAATYRDPGGAWEVHYPKGYREGAIPPSPEPSRRGIWIANFTPSFVREAPVPRHPYGVYYRVQPDRIVVIAVFHHSRDPAEWRDRV